MKIDWNEIDLIIRERSSKGSWSYMVQPKEMADEDLVKISFLIAEINSFPDNNQKKVGESGEDFRKYLSEKYRELSPESIDRLVHRFYFLNR